MAHTREELRERLRAPKPGVADEQNARLRNRLNRLRDLYSGGDLSEQAYRNQKADVEAQLLALPDNNKLVMFDRHGAFASSLPDAIAAATLVAEVTWVPAARPFFRAMAAETASVARPRRAGEAPQADEGAGWHVALDIHNWYRSGVRSQLS